MKIPFIGELPPVVTYGAAAVAIAGLAYFLYRKSAAGSGASEESAPLMQTGGLGAYFGMPGALDGGSAFTDTSRFYQPDPPPPISGDITGGRTITGNGTYREFPNPEKPGAPVRSVGVRPPVATPPTARQGKQYVEENPGEPA